MPFLLNPTSHFNLIVPVACSGGIDRVLHLQKRDCRFPFIQLPGSLATEIFFPWIFFKVNGKTPFASTY
jgi:hypothetical protein